MKKRLSLVLIVSILCTLFIPSIAMASDDVSTQRTVSYTYLDDGYYVKAVTDSISNPSKGSVTAGRTTTYYNVENEPLWYVYIKATFSYNGTNASCTYAKGECGSYSDWVVPAYPTVTVNGNSATAYCTGKLYFWGIQITSHDLAVTLGCSPTGELI